MIELETYYPIPEDAKLVDYKTSVNTDWYIVLVWYEVNGKHLVQMDTRYKSEWVSWQLTQMDFDLEHAYSLCTIDYVYECRVRGLM